MTLIQEKMLAALKKKEQDRGASEKRDRSALSEKQRAHNVKLSPKERNRRFVAKATAALEVLAKHYPQMFSGDSVKPFALGIAKQLGDARKAGQIPLTHNPMMVAVSYWVKSRAYVRALAQGGSRYNLDGTVAGSIAPEHQQRAQSMLERIESRESKAQRKANLPSAPARRAGPKG